VPNRSERGRRPRSSRAAIVLTAAAAAATAIAFAPAATAATPSTPNTPDATASATAGMHRLQLSAAAHRVGAARTPAARAAAIAAASPALPRITTAYGVPALWNAGDTGAGATVAVIESFGDPDAAQVLDSYDTSTGLPPAQLSTIAPAGPIPVCTPELEAQIGCDDWQGETDLDIVMIHSMAPQAHIEIVATPVNETQGFTGLPEMMDAVDYVAQHKLADVISMSFGTAEDDFPQLSDPTKLDWAFKDAKKAGIPLVASSGDCGSTGNTLTSAFQCGDVFPYRVASWPASDPYVVSAGGTVLHLGADGTQTSPATLWPDSGAGLSKTYARPSWQDKVAGITGSTQRSLPDITMEGIDGTSESAPLFAGVLALATQLHHGSLGFVNPALYQLGAKGAKAGILDVTSGSDGIDGVPGFTAAKGFDTASGWGTVDPATFVPALVKQIEK
jgi:subtilase family serine protease